MAQVKVKWRVGVGEDQFRFAAVGFAKDQRFRWTMKVAAENPPHVGMADRVANAIGSKVKARRPLPLVVVEDIQVGFIRLSRAAESPCPDMHFAGRNRPRKGAGRPKKRVGLVGIARRHVVAGSDGIANSVLSIAL